MTFLEDGQRILVGSKYIGTYERDEECREFYLRNISKGVGAGGVCEYKFSSRITTC